MVDRALIFQQVTGRNALRRTAGLPLLDVRAEVEHEVALAEAHEATEYAAQFADVRLLIRDQVIGELFSQKGRDYTQTMGGRWAINHTTNQRFRKWLLDEHKLSVADAPSRVAVVYGGGDPVDERVAETTPATAAIILPFCRV